MCALIACGPLLMDGLPTSGPLAAVVERTFASLAGGGLLIALVIVAAELFGGRSQGRALRLAGALVLLVAAGTGVVESSRHLLRPGTPIRQGGQAPSLTPTTSLSLARITLGWTSLGLVGATLVFGAGVGALRTPGRQV